MHPYLTSIDYIKTTILKHYGYKPLKHAHVKIFPFSAILTLHFFFYILFSIFYYSYNWDAMLNTNSQILIKCIGNLEKHHIRDTNKMHRKLAKPPHSPRLDTEMAKFQEGVEFSLET